MQYHTTKPMRKVAKVLRPRERLVAKGAANIQTEELLAILLRTGRKGSNVTGVAREILRKFPGQSLHQATVADLCQIDGISQAKAATIVAGIELGSRLTHKATVFPPVITSPEDVIGYVATLPKKTKEYFAVLYLNVKFQVIHTEIISIGIVDASLVHPREIFEPAIRHLASSIIMVHNHPSGDPTPSPEDYHITETIVQAGEILGISVADHIVVSQYGYTCIIQSSES